MLAILALPGCAIMQQAEIAAMTKETDAAKALCNKKFEQKKLKTYTALAECTNQAVLEVAKKYPVADGFIMYGKMVNAKRLELAEMVDQKKLTKAQAEVKLNEYIRGVVKEYDDQQAIAYQQYLQWNQQLQKALNPPTSAPTFMPVQPVPQSFNCRTTRFGNSLNTHCY